QKLGARTAVIFKDPAEAYSGSLADDFRKQFEEDGNRVLTTETYTVGKPETLQRLLEDALGHSPDLIYFSGHAKDMGVLLIDLSKARYLAQLQVMGGDGLYELAGYSPAASAKFNHLHFTAFAYPDEWNVLGLGEKPE